MDQVIDSGLYRQAIEVRWSDCDANKHMRHSAYSDFCVHARLGFLNKIGLDSDYMEARNIGPILFKEETEYRRESGLGDVITVVIEAVNTTEFSKSLQVEHKLYNSQGELAALHRCVIAWMDLSKRKIVAQPEQMTALIVEAA